MTKFPNTTINFDSTREVIFGRYYPITSDEANTLIGSKNDLISFMNDGPYKYLLDIAI